MRSYLLYIATLTIVQTVAQQNQLPLCAETCIFDYEISDSCAFSDYQCQCTKFTQSSTPGTCIRFSCTNADSLAAAQYLNNFCASKGYTITFTLPAVTGTEASAATSPAIVFTSAAASVATYAPAEVTSYAFVGYTSAGAAGTTSYAGVTNPTSTPSPTPGGASTLSPGVIAAIVLGSTLAVALVAGVAAIILWRRRKAKKAGATGQMMNLTPIASDTGHEIAAPINGTEILKGSQGWSGRVQYQEVGGRELIWGGQELQGGVVRNEVDGRVVMQEPRELP